MNSHNPRSFTTYESRQPYRPERHEPLRHEPLRNPSRTVSSDLLFRGDHEIGIEHHGALYRLKITRQGKLILNK